MKNMPKLLQDARKDMHDALKKYHADMEKAPKKFEVGEGVQDVDPFDADKHLEGLSKKRK